jgi:hypothetical protein
MASMGELPQEIVKYKRSNVRLMYVLTADAKGLEKQVCKQQNITKIECATSSVSIDQMVFPITGHMSLMKEAQTNESYNAATIFADNHSDITCVHLQKTTKAKETVEGKESFERWARTYNVEFKNFCTDNGWFAENLLMAHFAKLGQTISFCDVNAKF